MGSPQQVTGFSGPVKALTVGGEEAVSCALMGTGGVQCWSHTTPPIDQLPAGSGVLELRSTDVDYCAALSNGSVECWSNAAKDLATPEFASPVNVPWP
jgi:hypothetical protein